MKVRNAGKTIHGQGDGTGSLSIYGDWFEDENFDLQFDQPGLLAMVGKGRLSHMQANSGPNTNGCQVEIEDYVDLQFFITCVPTPHLNGKHVIFGRVLDNESLSVVYKIENLPCENDKPCLDVVISQCGELYMCLFEKQLRETNKQEIRKTQS